MALNQLPQFMNAIGTIESGNRYDAVGPYTGPQYGHARGRYQIMEKIWPGWAREAGVDPNDMSPEAQDRVASFKMQQYYNRYQNWDLVAVAWFAGPGRANKAEREGLQSLANINDKTATTAGTAVPTYVKKMRQAMGKAPLELQRGTTLAAEEEELAASTIEPEEDTFARDRQAMSSMMANIMSFVSEQASRSGGKVLDVRALFGEAPLSQPEPSPSPEPSVQTPDDDTLPPAPGEAQRAV